MPIIVMKFGGTSVANLERITAVATLIRTELSNGNRIVAVIQMN